MADSNRRPQRPERRALPAALIPEKKSFLKKSESFSRAAGLEPAIYGVTGQSDNEISYARSMYSIIY